MKRLCSVDGCNGAHKGNGYCGLHYQRYKRYGDPLKTNLIRHKLGTNTPEYRAWVELRRRCNDSTRSNWLDYGGRGISYDPRWEAYPNFLTDMGNMPTPSHSIDRIDNSKGYSKANCKWSTVKEQANNRRTSHYITYLGRTQTIQQWCDEYGIPDTTVHNRLKRGWTTDRLFTK